MKFTEEQARKVADRIEQLAGPVRTCPACNRVGTPNLQNLVITLPSVDRGPDASPLPSEFLPSVATVCQFCGRLELFGLYGLGVMDPTTGDLTV